jgi:ribulose-phosphate 3-epimerase
LLLDAHVVAHHADALAPQLAAAGAARVTFQLEVELTKPDGAAGALALARAIRAAGARCGVCVAPGTSEELLAPLLRAWHAPGDPLVDLVDVLAVAPGVGGQRFDDSVLAKVRAPAPLPPLFAYMHPHTPFGTRVQVRRIHEQYQGEGDGEAPRLRYLAVDGGVTAETAARAAASGANVLVAGTAVFGPGRAQGSGSVPGTVAAGLRMLRDVLKQPGL